MSAEIERHETAIMAEFRQAMAEQGLLTDDAIVADGKLHRFTVSGDKKKSRTGWFILYDDGKPAGAFGCNKRFGVGQKFTWSSKKPAKPLTLEERRAWAKKMAAQKAEREAAEREQRQAAASHAQYLWREAADCAGDDHPYLKRKGVKSFGLKVGAWEKIDPETLEIEVVSRRALLVPIRDTKKNIHSLQAIFTAPIYGDRDKDFVKNGQKEGLFYAFGRPQETDVLGELRKVIMIGEGYATLASAHEATGHAAVVAFDAGQLLAVGRVMRAVFPTAALVFLADNDQWTMEPVNNPGLTKAREAAAEVGGLVVYPPFAHSECKPVKGGNFKGPTDFNDWHKRHGLEGVRQLIEAALNPPAAVDFAMVTCDAKSRALLQTVPATREIASVNPEPIEAVKNSEDELALQFVERASNLRWSPGLGWLTDDGVVWARDEAMHHFDLARRVCRAAAAGCGGKAEAEAKRLSSAKTVAAVVTLARADRQLVVPASAWDEDPLLLNTPGGLVDLRTGTMRPRGIEYVTQVATVAPDFEAACPIWMRFLGQVFMGDEAMIEFMQRSMGYWLSGSTREQVIHFLFGQGSNGKSVLSDFVKWITGSYSLKLPATALMQPKGERHPTELAQLRGKRLALSSELGEADYFNESLLKELSGDATLTARFMRGDFFEFPLTQKHLIVGNFKPRLRGGDPAIARRMLLVPFKAVFTGADKDAQLPAKLRGEAPSILAWMIQGAVKWHSDGLAVPESVRTASAEYMAVMDDLKLWQAENCELEGEAKARDLYSDFAAWKKARGENAPSQTLWGERMATQPGIARRNSNGVKYVGIRLKPDDPGDWRTNTSYAHIRG